MSRKKIKLTDNAVVVLWAFYFRLFPFSISHTVSYTSPNLCRHSCAFIQSTCPRKDSQYMQTLLWCCHPTSPRDLGLRLERLPCMSCDSRQSIVPSTCTSEISGIDHDDNEHEHMSYLLCVTKTVWCLVCC